MRLKKKPLKVNSNEMEYKFILTGIEADDLCHILNVYLRDTSKDYGISERISDRRELAYRMNSLYTFSRLT